MPVLGVGRNFLSRARPRRAHVSDLDSLLEQLKASAIAVIVEPDWNSPELGRFARIHDPEGNAVELWEPPPAPAQ